MLVIQPYTNTMCIYIYVYEYIHTVYLSIVSMPQGCKSLANNGGTMGWHMMGSRKCTWNMYNIFICVYICVMLILMCHVNIYVYVLYIYIANFRIPQIHECPPQFCLLDIMSPHGTSEKKTSTNLSNRWHGLKSSLPIYRNYQNM